MTSRLAYLRELLRASFWFLPGLMTAAAVLLSFLLVGLQGLPLFGWIGDIDQYYAIGADGARAVLSTIAGSMITVASLVFSLTLVALTLASQQLGPRLLANFMRDRPTQIVLGVFVSTFAYTLLVLASISEIPDEAEVPVPAIVLALVFALASFCFLIYFIHHIALAIQADTVVDTVGRHFMHAVEEHFPEHAPQDAGGDAAPPVRPALPVHAPRSGYIEVIDLAALCRLADDRGLLVRLELRPGAFVLPSAVVAHVWGAGEGGDGIAGEVAGAVLIGARRTYPQDVAFVASALAEVGVRALSPGTNDPNTAIACIDRIAAGLSIALTRAAAPAVHRGADGRPRVLLDPVRFGELLELAFEGIRYHAGGDPSVLRRLAIVLAELWHRARDFEHRRAIAREAALLARTIERQVPDATVRSELLGRLETIAAATQAA